MEAQCRLAFPACFGQVPLISLARSGSRGSRADRASSFPGIPAELLVPNGTSQMATSRPFAGAMGFVLARFGGASIVSARVFFEIPTTGPDPGKAEGGRWSVIIEWFAALIRSHDEFVGHPSYPLLDSFKISKF